MGFAKDLTRSFRLSWGPGGLAGHPMDTHLLVVGNLANARRVRLAVLHLSCAHLVNGDLGSVPYYREYPFRGSFFGPDFHDVICQGLVSGGCLSG